MTKHTPGPWRYKEVSGFDYGSTMYWLPDICTNVTTEADARLIAAAPELLEALKECAAVCAGETMSKQGLVNALEKARAAIAKAEGSK